jgi:uncharacterized membrane protein YkoI
VLAVAAGGVGVAQAVGGGDEDERATGAAADRAGAAALRATGGGKVLETERADDGRRGYEVEVRKADGTTVEVHVTADGRVASTHADDDGGRDDD